MTLAAQLRAFMRATDDVLLAAPALRAGPHALQRYREGTVAAQVDALRAAYPTVLLLLDATAFEALAVTFARSTPARDWDLNAYGASLPDWIGTQQADADGAELADMARLDWAMHRASFAADAAPLDHQTLAAAPPGLQARLRLDPHPATALIASASPVHHLWRWARDQALTVTRGTPQTVLVGRDGGHRVWMRPLAPAEAAFVACSLAGQVMADALAAALAIDPAFDLAGALRRELEEQTWRNARHGD